jgi:hypothetical protein
VLAALRQEGLITLEQVMQDSTKIKALASIKSYQQEGIRIAKLRANPAAT